MICERCTSAHEQNKVASLSVRDYSSVKLTMLSLGVPALKMATPTIYQYIKNVFIDWLTSLRFPLIVWVRFSDTSPRSPDTTSGPAGGAMLSFYSDIYFEWTRTGNVIVIDQREVSRAGEANSSRRLTELTWRSNEWLTVLTSVWRWVFFMMNTCRLVFDASGSLLLIFSSTSRHKPAHTDAATAQAQ